MERRTISIIFLSIYLGIIIISLFWASCQKLDIGDWISLISLLVFGGVFMLSGLGEILRVLHEPRLKIERVYVNLYNEGLENEIKNLCFIVKNNGKEEAQDCKIEFEMDDKNFIWHIGNIYPDDTKPFTISSVENKTDYVLIYTDIRDEGERSSIKLEKGKIYKLTIMFKGKNFGRKVFNLRLDFSSWENVGIKSNC